MIKEHKRIHDIIHGYIIISDIAQKIIDTKYFQRMRYMKQLGIAYIVFPNTNHTRFEHSLGVYHLAGKLLDCIKSRTPEQDLSYYLSQIPELQDYFTRNNKNPELDDYICELIKIAGLCHDIGHSAFSHAFDDFFIHDKTDSKYKEHEERSTFILEYLIKTHKELKIIITQEEINFMKNLISPKKEHTSFIYQIISNNLNSLDVDKYDYIVRDSLFAGFPTGFDPSRLINDIYIINNNICYPKQIVFEIYRLFLSRYQLHKQIYNHKAVIGAQLLLCDILNLIEEKLEIVKIINKFEDRIEEFILLTDNYILESINFLHIPEASYLLNRLKNHDLYTFIGEKLSNDVITYTTKIGFVSGNKENPFDNIYVYNNKNNSYKLNIEDITGMMPVVYQEDITLRYIK